MGRRTFLGVRGIKTPLEFLDGHGQYPRCSMNDLIDLAEEMEELRVPSRLPNPLSK